MPKPTVSDIRSILRKYKVDGVDKPENRIESVKSNQPSNDCQAITFRFGSRNFILIYDQTAEDDTNYLYDQIKQYTSGENGYFFENPENNYETYGLDYKSKVVYLYSVSQAKKRLDIALASRHDEISRSTLQKYIRGGHVTVNGQTVTSPKTEVLETDTIELDIPTSPDFSKNELPVLYCDDNVIVIDKPIGVLSHAKGTVSEEFTVAEFLRRFTEAGLDTNRPGIIHRLDRDTSGVMIGARNESTAKLLARQFNQRKVKKTYIAVVEGKLKEPEAILELPIARSPLSPSTFRVDGAGKMAITHYKVLRQTNEYSVVELSPTTGRTHQLRVHMAYLGAPILGDRVYGRAADRLYLHAKSLEITIPTGNRKIFTAPMPPDFDKYIKDY